MSDHQKSGITGTTMQIPRKGKIAPRGDGLTKTGVSGSSWV